MTSEPLGTGELKGRRWWFATLMVFLLAMGMTCPTLGDNGLTWDEPAYRFSQLRSAQWWERLGDARSASDISDLLDPDALLFYWPYARYGINFHPPLSGQINLLTHTLFRDWIRDIPARRLASVIEYCLTISLAFGFLSRRYGPMVGLVAAGSLLLMPRLQGDAHIAGTDTPGLLIWPAITLAFWKGLHEQRAARWRVLVGVLVGLAFVQKMATVFVIAPLILWLLAARLPRTLFRPGGRADWIDGLATSTALLTPLVLALLEILRISREFKSPEFTDLFVDRPTSLLPGAWLAVPLAAWLGRRLLSRLFPRSSIWGTERPALEIWAAILAFAPVVGWLGCPPWWRETFPRLAHYYMINTQRRGALPDIQIFYMGQIYEYSLPWHNAWVLMAVTVPAAILVVACLGIAWSLKNARKDRLPLFFLVQLATLPVFRMLPTPAHDGVRLFLPTFFFLAAMAGWGARWAAVSLEKFVRPGVAWLPRVAIAGLVLVPSAWQLAKVHPFELSYYNEFIGGARGAWSRGYFELTYWYDAFNPRVLAEINAKLPRNVEVDILNDKTNTSMPVFLELQALGDLRSDIRLGWRDTGRFPHVFLLTQDSKASAFTRLLFAIYPWYEARPPQLDGLRVATVADPPAVATAWALWLLTDAPDDLPPERAQVPPWVRESLPFLGRFWGEGLTKVARLNAYAPTFEWARADPSGLRAAARGLVARSGDPGEDPDRRRLRKILDRYPGDRQGQFADLLFRAGPDGLVNAVAILTTSPDAVENVVKRYAYTEPVAEGLPWFELSRPTPDESE